MQLNKLVNSNDILVSILMTAYNREKYIAEAIESVLASSHKNFELIIVDDGSTDNTISIVQKFAHADKRISLYQNEQNLKDYPNRNRAASYAKGEYIMYVDSDDKTYTDSIEYCLNEMIKDPVADMGMLCREPDLCGKVLPAHDSLNHHFFKKAFLTIGPGGTIIKRSFFEKIKGYPEKYGPANDMYFNLKAATAGHIKCLCKEFLFYRIHDGQEFNNKTSYLYNNYRYLQDALVELNMPLSIQQKKWLSKKSKRRFLVNIIRFFIQTFSVKKTRLIIGKAGFGYKDALHGIFN